MSTPVTPPPNGKRKKVMWITIGIFVVIGAIVFFYWLFIGRFYTYTNDAYVNGNQVFLTPQISGIVTQITSDDTDFVPEGRVLVTLDPTDRVIFLNERIAELGSQVREVCRLFERVPELAAAIAQKKAVLIRTAQDFEHRIALIDEGAVSIEDLEHATAALKEAFADLELTEHQYIAAVAQVENTTVEDHPWVLAAEEKLREAYVNLRRCTILAPVTGLVAQRNVQVGKQVRVGEPMLALVPLNQMWIDANFKEVQLSKVRIGQPATVTVDFWGSDVIFHGKVVGIGGGTGSIFSVLPPQNATGNWIKIVQRIPVRIALDPEKIALFPLRLGLSCEVTIDLHHIDREMVPAIKPDTPIYATDVISSQEEGVDDLIADVIADNLSWIFIEDLEL